LLLPGVSLAEAQAVAQAICERVRARTLARKSSGDTIGVVTISLGVAAFRSGDSGDSLVKRTDACLYQAKRGGRNRVVSEVGSAAAAA
jgi:diguanylate cyclase